LGYEQGKYSNDIKKANTTTTKKKEDSLGLENDGFTWVQSRRRPYASLRTS